MTTKPKRFPLPDSYLTPLGNPLNERTLPTLPMSLEFPYRGRTLREAGSVRNWTLGTLLSFDLSVVIGWVFIGQSFPLATLAWPVLFGLFHGMEASINTGPREMSRSLAVILGTFLAAALCRFYGLHSFLVPAIIWGAFALRYLRHFSHRCTTSPMPQEVARSLRQRWMENGLVACAVPFAGTLLAILLKASWPLPVAVIAYVGCQVIGSREVLRGIVRSLTSWCAYKLDNRPLPGVFESPEGSADVRRVRLGTYAIAFAVAVQMSTAVPSVAGDELLRWLLYFPFTSFLLLTLMLTAPLLGEMHAEQQDDRSSWQQIITSMRCSDNPMVRDSYFVGFLAADGSPLPIPRRAYGEHAHILGSIGIGKTSRGLCPWVEQTIGFGDCSLIVVDMKGDTSELYATMAAATEEAFKRTGQRMPLKFFSSQDDVPTYTFNPLASQVWQRLNLYQRSDIICGALGLVYGADYGEGYYSAANAALVYESFRMSPQSRSLLELSQACRQIIKSPKSTDLAEGIARDAGHVYETLRRFASCAALQVVPEEYPADVCQQAIDLADMYRRPQSLYLHLPAMLSPGTAPAIARLFAYTLLTVAPAPDERTCPVYLVIDEFQRMAAQNLEYLLQLARSIGVGVILANQSMTDLKRGKMDLTGVVETNCRVHQWFDTPTLTDMREVSEWSGEALFGLAGEGTTISEQRTTFTESERDIILPRLGKNELLAISSNPELSIVRVSKDMDYVQFAGLPVVIRSPHHINKEEYERRKKLGWPAFSEGMIVPEAFRPSGLSVLTRSTAANIVIDEQDARTGSEIDLEQLLDDKPAKRRKNRRKKEEGHDNGQ